MRDRVVNSATGQGLETGEELETHLSPPNARRRATLHALRTQNGVVLGFRKARSHKLVDLAECPVSRPELVALLQPLRSLLASKEAKGAVDVQLTLVDQGVDVGLANFPLNDLRAIEAATEFAREHALARLSVDQGFGPETQWEPEPVTVTLSGTKVTIPPGSFLQATADAEMRMIADARQWAEGKRLVADLFSGLGTFAFALSKNRKVLAAEAERAAHLACKSAAERIGGSVYPIHRDLFRNPLQAKEISRFDAVVLDPPRAGAKAQIAEIAASEMGCVIYASCNPSSWARDAARLADAGFRLAKLRPIGQFRWSTHVELTSLFLR